MLRINSIRIGYLSIWRTHILIKIKNYKFKIYFDCIEQSLKLLIIKIP
jgi:hypothetical protein